MKVNANIARIWRPTAANGQVSYALHARSTHQSLLTPHTVSHAADTELVAPPERFSAGLFTLSPQTKRYLVGVLADTSTHGMVLGLTTYMSGGHHGVIDAMKQQCGAVEAVWWGGELYLEQSGDHAGSAALHSINNTSGFLNERARQEQSLSPHPFAVDNTNAHLISRLAKAQLFALSNTLKCIPFSPATPHLYTQTAWPKVEGLNFRHSMGGKLLRASKPIHFYSSCAYKEGDRGVELFGDDVQATLAFCQVLQATDPFDPVALMILMRDLQKMLDGKRLDLLAYKVLDGAFEGLADHFREKMHIDCGNEYDLIVLAN